MTDDLRPIRNPMELHRAIADAAALYPGDLEAAVQHVLNNYALDPVMAESLKIQGRRELEVLN